MRFLQIYFASAYISTSIVLSLLLGFTTHWEWTYFNAWVSLNIFLTLTLATSLIAIICLVAEYVSRKGAQK
ncbi:hypothetical protein NT95_06155 (plasmid) [Oenococcus kitaharae]|nr:hypothetical protein NV75_08385 [Oenococcus kitaharae]OEY82549.1 hypothetical protein NT95_06155 [Oenococcus kitaharae]OEY84200.1 hypothetical protein NT96_05300 [Oenococcus kitaharae]